MKQYWPIKDVYFCKLTNMPGATEVQHPLFCLSNADPKEGRGAASKELCDVQKSTLQRIMEFAVDSSQVLALIYTRNGNSWQQAEMKQNDSKS